MPASKTKKTEPDKAGSPNVRADEKSNPPAPQTILDRGRRVLRLEVHALTGLIDSIDEAFVEAVRLIAECRGKVVVTGMGKAGLIGQKIAATMSSTGTPSMTLHPADAMHGDLGMVGGEDVVLALSNSGASEELKRMLPLLKQLGCRIVLITGRPQSACGKLSDVALSIGQLTEACPLGLAPSSSTTAMLAMGDALALTVMEEKNFHPQRYAEFHPGGSLGRQLMGVKQIMRRAERCPRVPIKATVREAMQAIAQTPGRAGATSVVDADGKLVGLFTDGDLRRLLDRDGTQNPRQTPIVDAMTHSPKIAKETDTVLTACATMGRYKIDDLPVIDEEGRLVGMLDIQDLLAAGFTVYDEQ